MEVAYLLNGGAPRIKKYPVAATMANVGALTAASTAGEAGIALATTTSAADAIGPTLDTATYVTAQQTDGTSAERLVTVVINPDAVYRMLISGGATDGTALTQYDVTTASAAGTAVTTGDDFSSPQMDEGVIWGYSGANAGQKRKITSTSTTAATVTVAFDQDTVVGDNFLVAPYWFFQTSTIQLTTNLTQADGSIAVGTGGEFTVVDLLLRDQTDSGTTNSFVLAAPIDHALNRA